MANNPINKDINDFVNRKWLKFANDLQLKIKSELAAGKDINTAINSAFKFVKPNEKINPIFLSSLIDLYTSKGVQLSGSVQAGINLQKGYNKDSLKLSVKVNPLFSQKIIKNELKHSFKNIDSWNKAASQFDKLPYGDISKQFTKLSELSKSVLTNKDDLKEYTKQLQITQKYVDKLAKNNAPNTQLKAAYQNLIDKTKTFNTKAIDSALKVAIQEKARYNAERITRTEYAKAYGTIQLETFANDSDVTGVIWELSSRHLIYDICNLHAESNIFGMGAGVYPKTNVPSFPAHPHCLCVLAPFYGDAPNKIDTEKAKQKQEKLIEDLPKVKKAKLKDTVVMAKSKSIPKTQQPTLPPIAKIQPLPPQAIIQKVKVQPTALKKNEFLQVNGKDQYNDLQAKQNNVIVTKTQEDALLFYKHAGYDLVNEQLRRGYNDPMLTSIIKEVSSIYNSKDARTPENLILNRGIRLDNAFGKNFNPDRTQCAGMVFPEKGFISTSTDINVTKRSTFTRQGDIILRMEIPKGTKGLFIEKYDSSFTEMEVLIKHDPKHKIKLLRYIGKEDGRYVYEAKLYRE